MEITVIGWYGTETIGDRAILAGIFKLFSDVYPSFGIKLGSLFPFFTERTVSEDISFYKSISRNRLERISIFDSMNPIDLKKNIRNADLLIVGGGPLEDLPQMHMLEYAFTYAKRKNVRSMLIGCGWGPLVSKDMVDIAIHLVEMSEKVIFREDTSKKQCLDLCPQYSNKVSSSIDPAFIASHYFRTHIDKKREESHIAINFRDVLFEGNYKGVEFSFEKCAEIVNHIMSQSDLPIYLVPMHNFYIGGDDRVILNEIKCKVNSERVKVFHEPLSLYETMELYYHAKYCIGMRFHSIVLQTMLNGNNYIIDYTDPDTGKIVGMMRQLQITDFYKNRYYSLYKGDDISFTLYDDTRFSYNPEMIKDYTNRYVQQIEDPSK